VSPPAFAFADRRAPRTTWAWLRAIAVALAAGILCLGATVAVIIIAARATAAKPDAPPPPVVHVTTLTTPAPAANGGIASALNPGDRSALPTTTLGVLTPPISTPPISTPSPLGPFSPSAP
jgi:hypothetical protein